jgi:DNA-binding GntR family transcriptional regulator
MGKAYRRKAACIKLTQIRCLSQRERENKRFPDSRGQIILTAIINEHFVTGEPVGSKVLAEKFANQGGMSSATIRNVMGELEEMGC